MEAVVNEIAGRRANAFAEAVSALCLAVGAVDHVRHIVRRVSPRRQRRRMIGRYQNAEILACRNEVVIYRFDYLTVDNFDRAHFALNIALVSALVGGFKVSINEINAFFEPLYRCIGFALKV